MNFKNISPEDYTLYLSYGQRLVKPGGVVEVMEKRDKALMERMSYKIPGGKDCKGCGSNMSGTAPAFTETEEEATVSPTIKQKQIAESKKSDCAPCEKKRLALLAASKKAAAKNTNK